MTSQFLPRRNPPPQPLKRPSVPSKPVYGIRPDPTQAFPFEGTFHNPQDVFDRLGDCDPTWLQPWHLHNVFQQLFVAGWCQGRYDSVQQPHFRVTFDNSQIKIPVYGENSNTDAGSDNP